MTSGLGMAGGPQTASVGFGGGDGGLVVIVWGGFDLLGSLSMGLFDWAGAKLCGCRGLWIFRGESWASAVGVASRGGR